MSLTIGLVSYHTSPLASPGSGDAGGMNIVVRHHAEALGAAGHTVEVFTRRSDPFSPDSEPVAQNVTLHYLPAGEQRAYAKSELDRFLIEFGQAMRRRNLSHLDLLHAHHWMSGIIAGPLATELGIPHLVSYHSIAAPTGSTELAEGEPAESPHRVDGEEYLAHTADLVVAISRAEADIVAGRLGGRADRIRVVLPGVDVDTFRPGGRPAPDGSLRDCPCEDAPAEPYLAIAARLQPLKGIELALRALAHVPEDIRPHLVVSGADSEDFPGYADELAGLARELGVVGRVRFAGPQSRDALATLLRCSTITLIPSFSETYGLIALEAAASGVPVIAYDTGGLREAVDNGTTGLLLPDRDPEAWGEAITTLLRQTDVALAMGRAGREHAERMTWDASAQRLVAVYEEVIDPSFGTRPHVAGLDGGTVVVVHAHPDDETIATGALLAHLVDRGVHVAVVTCTRGEKGEIVPGSADDIDTAEALVERREHELANALKVLGVPEHHFLGQGPARWFGKADRRYTDSGMEWVRPGLAGPSAEADEDSLTAAEPEEPAADLGALLEHLDADLLISYDDAGSYGHPDHVRTHELTMLAARATETPFVEIVSAGDSDEGPDVEWIELGGRFEQVQQALSHHRTQLTVDGHQIVHVGGQREDISTTIGLRFREA